MRAIEESATLPSSDSPSQRRGPGQLPIFDRGEMLCGIYEVGETLGEGGMGQVFEANDHALARRVAIKAAWPHIPGSWLLDEARSLAAVDHPSLLRVHALGTHRDVNFLVTERLYGATLEKKLDEQRRRSSLPTPRETLDVLMRVADALVVIHAAGLVHRDLKPSNIILAPKDRVVLMDFGVALAEVHVESRRAAAGSLAYMAPESLTTTIHPGEGHLVDVYAFGVLAYEMLTGQLPFSGSAAELCALHLRRSGAPDVRALHPGVSELLAELVQGLLSPRPSDRPQTMDLVVWQLRSLRASLPDEGEERFYALIVDDDPDILRLLARVVRGAVPDSEVRTCSSGEQAIEALTARAPSLLLLDLSMPGTNGIEVGMHLRGGQLAPQCTVVSISASATDGDRALLAGLGVEHFLKKGPALESELLPIITAVHRQSRWTGPRSRRSIAPPSR